MKVTGFSISIGIAFLVCLPSLTFAQSLTMHRTFGNTRFEYHNDTATFTVSPKQVLDIMHDDPLALAEFRKARYNYSIAGVMGFAGGLLIAFPISKAIAGGEPEWALATAGAVIIIASIPLSMAFRRHAEGAIDIYNKKHTAFYPHTEYFFSGLGAQVVIKF